MSRASLYNKVKALTVGVNDYINKIRIEKASSDAYTNGFDHIGNII